MFFYEDLMPGLSMMARNLRERGLLPGDVFNFHEQKTLWLVVGHWTVTEEGVLDGPKGPVDDVYTLTLVVGSGPTLVTFRNLLARGFSIVR